MPKLKRSRLIAAAPKLLNLLHEVLNLWDEGYFESALELPFPKERLGRLHYEITQVIAEAEGRPNA